VNYPAHGVDANRRFTKAETRRFSEGRRTRAAFRLEILRSERSERLRELLGEFETQVDLDATEAATTPHADGSKADDTDTTDDTAVADDELREEDSDDFG